MSHPPALVSRAAEGRSRQGPERNDDHPGASRGTGSGLRPQDQGQPLEIEAAGDCSAIRGGRQFTPLGEPPEGAATEVRQRFIVVEEAVSGDGNGVGDRRAEHLAAAAPALQFHGGVGGVDDPAEVPVARDLDILVGLRALGRAGAKELEIDRRVGRVGGRKRLRWVIAAVDHTIAGDLDVAASVERQGRSGRDADAGAATGDADGFADGILHDDHDLGVGTCRPDGQGVRASAQADAGHRVVIGVVTRVDMVPDAGQADYFK